MEEVNCVLGEDEHDGIVDVDTPEAVPDRPAQRLEGRQIQSLLARIESVRFEQLDATYVVTAGDGDGERFLEVWARVLRDVRAPNLEQKRKLYRP